VKIVLNPDEQVSVSFEGVDGVITVHFDKQNSRLLVNSDYLGEVYNESLEEHSLELPAHKDLLNLPVTDFNFPLRAQNVFTMQQIKTMGDLTSHTRLELLSFPNMGAGSVTLIEQMLKKLRLRLR
jgi:DNA-directed RNA polymerase alpha subunit